jgi:cytidylate kinase
VRLVFLHGPVASGKLTIGRLLAERTGYALFHNHLIVDAVGAVFPFGSEAFVRLRERFWLETMAEAAAARRSLIFTFAPEPTVGPASPTAPGRWSRPAAAAWSSSR